MYFLSKRGGIPASYVRKYQRVVLDSFRGSLSIHEGLEQISTGKSSHKDPSENVV